MKLLAGLALAVFVVVAGGVAAILSGAFNVAATNPDSSMTTWILHTTMQRSVAVRSSAIVAPESFTEAQVQAGSNEFRAMCAGCHGAPGRMRSAAGKGLRPRAPDLAVVANNWTNANLFWIIKNGIKMTGMPAFGPTHDDQTLWNIVAFVRQLPNMTADQYQRFADEGRAAGNEHEH
ncbi:MAG: cytochrome c [Hyphomicrobium sp.]|uniref:c-type cytochrome n=1 Tax=Hyphomicrobium sp. TaxID=82 RepID=UPI0013211024|nr:cytochrome c [Hyphomicrobium sp.]KAB2943106.1 MAG: cytochrome c [Hyphomicrobium sp.]MBZ0208991.1 cytochrome c [Hyphomicrobium sp.]